MRIICPNCDAQYEVDDDAIPSEGRDVQCSNCGNAWFQVAPPGAEKLTAALYQEPAPPPAPPEALDQADEDDPLPDPAPAPRRSLDDAVLSVLREEAEREVQARKVEAQGLEMQGDLGLPPPVNPAVGRPLREERASSEPEMTDAERHIARMKGMPVPQQKPAARRDLLPDIEEINSSLKPSDVAQPVEYEETGSQPEKSGFRSGFTLMLIIAVVVIALYVMAPNIAVQIPELAGTMDAYVSAVDALRLGLDSVIRKATAFLQGLAGA